MSADPQAYGRLATEFHEALAETRAALGGHSKLLPDGRLARFDSLLRDFDRRRVRIAIHGEVKAGKSTLINAIAGSALSPASFGPLTSVPIRITYGEETSWTAGGQSFQSVEELAEAMRDAIAVDEVKVTTNLDLLRLGGQVDLVDTPGVGSDDAHDEVSARALRALDAVILVVRYPALFTKFTRNLMRDLEGDVSKLFVVWNTDATCHELSPAELEEQIETLRRDVAGAHDLFTVDGKSALEAAVHEDPDKLSRSGMNALIDGLRNFVTSDERGVAAIREAAKRVEKWMRQADDALQKRKAQLEASLEESRTRLEAIGREADASTEQTREAHEAFVARSDEIAEQHRERAAASAKKFRKQLRKVRRSWFWNGDAETLATATSAAAEAYADEVDATMHATADGLHAAADSFGTVVGAAPRHRFVPAVGALGPEERLAQAAEGRFKRTRRSLRRGTYIPGFALLYSKGVDADLASQEEWLEATIQAAQGAASATLDAKVAEIDRQAEAARAQLKRDRAFDAESAELATLERDVPVVSKQREAISRMAGEARALASAG